MITYTIQCEVQNGDIWQALEPETIEARDLHHVVSLVDADGLEPGTVWRAHVYAEPIDWPLATVHSDRTWQLGTA